MDPQVDPILAAGVVVVRSIDDVDHVLVVHRAARNDWSLPKGKLEPEEHPVVAAVRECEEEAGVEVALGVCLGRITYPVDGRTKAVDYWRARPEREHARPPDDEVDEVRWVPADACDGLLTYPHDAELVRAATESPPTTPLIILRHAQAMKRVDFDGDDDSQRPLTIRGEGQAEALVPLLRAFGIQRVHSSSAVRCRDTVRPLARALGVPIHAEPHLSEQGFDADPSAGVASVHRLLRDREPSVLCTHRPVLPAVLATIAEQPRIGRIRRSEFEPSMPPGTFVVVHRTFADDGSVVLAALERHRGH